MITEIQSDLIGMLKSMGLDRETTVNIMVLMETDELREKLMREIALRYEKKGEVAEQDILKFVMILTGSRKSSVDTSTKTEA